jgi:hypothetical protein
VCWVWGWAVAGVEVRVCTLGRVPRARAAFPAVSVCLGTGPWHVSGGWVPVSRGGSGVGGPWLVAGFRGGFPCGAWRVCGGLCPWWASGW